MYLDEFKTSKKKPASAEDTQDTQQDKMNGKKTTPAPNGEPAEEDPEPEEDLPSILKKLNEVRQFYSNTTTQATNMSNLIATQVSWSFANNDALGGKLTKLQEAVEKSCTPFFRTLLTSSVQQLKKNYTATELRGNMKSATDMKAKITEMNKLLMQLQASHAIFNPAQAEKKKPQG